MIAEASASVNATRIYIKASVNECIQNNEDILHRIEMVIDLSDAYLQTELSEESKKMGVINAHKILLLYIRLPCGIKTASGVFNKL
ncbi:hypothetical protein OSTOST_10785 [Ostertagia ostertagi]